MVNTLQVPNQQSHVCEMRILVNHGRSTARIRARLLMDLTAYRPSQPYQKAKAQSKTIAIHRHHPNNRCNNSSSSSSSSSSNNSNTIASHHLRSTCRSNSRHLKAHHRLRKAHNNGTLLLLPRSSVKTIGCSILPKLKPITHHLLLTISGPRQPMIPSNPDHASSPLRTWRNRRCWAAETSITSMQH